ncbi:STE24 endopeptidase [Muriicola jejuensis]|uniref:M48 family metalloprotease n=1 Tax=Muriicola jejuensis TaxID=504488 RepID=A0A6P0UC22_9FLAO|nr:M48 family metallopeptidase [Muriicola jejuensis]NER10805.1 M48 family metalloprotease [Muriicola jejuensis]SMP16224.1 STE24 endopeptidase [Muriicola jejuensis]
MNSSSLFYLIIAILILEFLVESAMDYLNTRSFAKPIPPELSDVYDPEEYARSQAYKKANYSFGLFTSSFSIILLLSFLLLGGFQWVDQVVRGITEEPIGMALLFFGIIALGSDLLMTPFSYYKTFVIEERFGFNKSNLKLFLTDKIKGWILLGVLGGGMLALVILFYEWTGRSFWLYAWGLIAVFTLFMNLFYSKLIVPLFNKQKPLQEGSLRQRIQNYAEKVGFELEKIFVIDGSRRSTKANAYFSGFGREKRVTLYDTLIEDLEEEEIVAVLAHEVGHYKRRHIIYNLVVSTALTGLTLFILSLFINHPEVSGAIGVEQPSFHAALVGFALLYSPISQLTGLAMNYLSRQFEYQADEYARKTYGGEPLISSLKKLSRNSLSNLTPHPAYVFMHYSHPPLISRVRRLQA